MVDMADLKSAGPKGPFQFDSGLGYNIFCVFLFFVVVKLNVKVFVVKCRPNKVDTVVNVT